MSSNALSHTRFEHIRLLHIE
ncbi:hypothetical protein V3C99_000073 [Haemonchus contortus]